MKRSRDERSGEVSDTSIWRWLKDPALDFGIVIGSRRIGT